MRNRKMIWAREHGPTVQPIRRATDVTNLEPDALRDSVRNALSALSADEQASWRDHLLNGLREAGLNLGACSFLIGISANSTNDPDAIGYCTSNPICSNKPARGDEGSG